jgi:tripartite-type tricarboxylate transporter receptor subunit TctC
MMAVAKILLAALLFAQSPFGLAQEAYPTKPITLVVPYPPGGSNDVFARIVAKELAEMTKQVVLVDNRPGASGSTGTAAVSRASADGYTLVAVSSSMVTNAAIQAKLPFDPVKGLTPVATLAEGPFIVAVNNSFAASISASTPKDLIAAIRSKPGSYNYASSGTGSVNQFATELLKAKAGKLFITHIPYRGMGPAVTDLVGGQTQLLLASGPSLMPMIRSGKLRAIGVTSLGTHPIAPDLMPMSSAVPGYEFSLWWALFAPAGTPSAIADKLNGWVNQILAKPHIRAQFLREGAETLISSPVQLGQRVVRDIERWKALAKQQGIVAE